MTDEVVRGLWETYLPLKSGISIHQNFAALPIRATIRFPGEVLRFVYWFGFLTSAEGIRSSLNVGHKVEEIEHPEPPHGEHLEFWRDEVRDFRYSGQGGDSRSGVFQRQARGTLRTDAY